MGPKVHACVSAETPLGLVDYCLRIRGRPQGSCAGWAPRHSVQRPQADKSRRAKKQSLPNTTGVGACCIRAHARIGAAM